jgi:hypothetical protein
MTSWIRRRGAGGDELGVGGVGLRVAQVHRDRVVEQVRVLADDPDGGGQRGQREVPDVVAVDGDPPFGDVVEAWDERRQRGLPGARRADERHHRARAGSTSMSRRIQSDASSPCSDRGPSSDRADDPVAAG